MIGAIVTSTAAVGAVAETSPATRIDARQRSRRRGTDAAHTDGGQA